MTNNKQSSSVDWFLDELIKEGYIKKLPVTQLQQAKEMEKDQHIKSWETGLMKVDFNEYYNKTYGDDKQ